MKTCCHIEHNKNFISLFGATTYFYSRFHITVKQHECAEHVGLFKMPVTKIEISAIPNIVKCLMEYQLHDFV